jgi:hypothetical protein
MVHQTIARGSRIKILLCTTSHRGTGRWSQSVTRQYHYIVRTCTCSVKKLRNPSRVDVSPDWSTRQGTDDSQVQFPLRLCRVAIDIGTLSSDARLVRSRGRLVAHSGRKFSQPRDR